MKKIFTLLSVLISFASSAQWTAVAPLTTGVAQHAGVAHPNGKIYVVGGYNDAASAAALTTMQVYTPSTNTWAAGVACPTALRGAGFCLGSDNNIYVISGYSSAYSTANYRFNPTTNTWSTLAAIPTAVLSSSAASYGGKVYVAGGNNGSSYIATLQIYDIATNTWSTGAAMPVGLTQHLMVSDNAGALYVFGGTLNGFSQTAAIYKYTIATNTWSTSTATLPATRNYFGAALASDGKIHLAGGKQNFFLNSSPFYYTAWIFDPATNTITNDDPLPISVAENTLVASGTDIYCIGGATGGTNSITTVYKSSALQGPGNVVTGIQLWLDGSNINNTIPATNPANATALTTWKDVSGNSNNATVLAGQNTPVMNTSQINGKDVVSFTRTSGSIGTVYNVPNVDIRSTTMPQTTIFTVYRQGAHTGSDLHGIWGDDNGGWDRFFMSAFGSNNGVVSVGPPLNNVGVTNSGITGQTKLLTAVYDHGVTNGSTIYFNALPVQSVTDNTDPVAAQTTLRIGFDGDDNPYNGDIAEMIVYNRKLTDCEIKDVNRYLGYKYGVSFSTATITPSPNVYFCTGGNVTLTASSGTAYKWLLNGSIISGATSSTYVAGVAGSYRAIVTASGCDDTSAATAVQEVFSTIYVDSAIAVSGTGASWLSPKKTVDEALDMANSTTCAVNIFVRKGTYYPMTSGTTVATSRDSSLRILRNNIKLYGGFAGTESSPATRISITGNPTILSGDIGVANDSTDNAYHVITAVSTAAVQIDSNTIIDGFTIRDGNALGGGSFTVSGQAFNQQDGAGIYLAGGGTGNNCSPKFANDIFTRNTANYGGGIYVQGGSGGASSPVINNCTFSKNFAAVYGGGLVSFCTGRTNKISISNSTFTQNTANLTGNTGGGAALYTRESQLTMTGCTVSFNKAQCAAGIKTDRGLCTISNTAFNNDTTIGASGNTYYGGADVWTTAGGAAYHGFGDTASYNNCTFSGNQSYYGGAIFVTALISPMTFVSVTKCTFDNNGTTGNIGACAGSLWGGRFQALNSIFTNNTGAGAVGSYNTAGDPAATDSLIQCVFVNNNGNGGGGIGYMQGLSNLALKNCTGYNNVGGASFRSVYNGSSGTVSIDNSIIWGPAQTQTGGNAITHNNSIVNNPTVTATNFNLNPQFVNPSNPIGPDGIWGTADDGLRISMISPALNTGSNALVPAAITTDFINGARIQATTVDMGAYEGAVISCPAGPRVYVDSSIASSGNGTTWALAFKTVWEALTVANSCPAVNEIWVKKGTYFPMITAGIIAASRDSSLRISRNGIKIYGGFSVTDTIMAQRKVTINKTILSGDIGTVSDSTDNVYHVMTIAGPAGSPVDTTTLVNGFTVTRGQADGASSSFALGTSYVFRSDGGGIDLTGTAGGNSSPKIDSCTFTKNYAVNGAGLYSSAHAGGTSSPVVRASTFTNNNAGNNGGGYVAYADGTSPVLSPQFYNCSFGSNKATTAGGAFYISANSATAVSKPIISSCSFTNHVFAAGSGYGGASYIRGNDSTLPQFTNCTITGNAGANGGGLYFENIGNGTVTNCTLSNNLTYFLGGGIDFNNSGGTVSNCTLSNNNALYGGNATYGGAIGSYNAAKKRTLTVSGTSFTGNHSYSNGGGIFIGDSVAVVINNCTSSANTAQSGGFMHTQAQGLCNLSVSNSTFSNDTAFSLGGIFRNSNLASSAYTNCKFLNSYCSVTGAFDLYNLTVDTFTNCLFSGNKSAQYGAAIHNFQAITTLINCVFTDNSTTTNSGNGGGAIHTNNNSVVNAYNCTFSNNTTAVTSGTFAGSNTFSIEGSTALTLNNTIVWGAAANQIAIGGGTVTYNYSDVKGVTPTATNLNADPQFINASNAIGADNIWGTTDDGLRMTPCSPAINAGSNALVPVTLTTDFTAAARIQQTTVDMGAYEMPYASTGLPSTTITMSPANPVCAVTSVTFTATTLAPGAGPSYQWYKNGIPVGLNQNTFVASGWVNGDSVWVIHTNNVCNLKDTSNHIILSVTPIPVQPAAITGNLSICSSSTQTYSIAAVSPATSYTWTVPTGWTITSGQGTITLNVTAGTASGNVSVTANTFCGSSPARTVAVIVTTPPAAPGTITGNTAVCAGSVNTYSITAITGATTYTWSVPTGWSITAGQGGTSITVTASTAASSSGNVSVTSGNTCFTSAAATLAVTSGFIVPGVAISALPSGAICQGTSVTFTATPANGGTAPLYTWRKNGVTVSTGTGNTYTDGSLNNNDVISVRLSVFIGCVQPDSAVTSSTITVNPIPAITSAVATGTTTCSGTNGSVALSGLLSNVAYTVNFARNGTAQTAQTITTSATGVLTITGLNAGSYSGFSATRLTCTSPVFAGPAVVADPAIPAAPTASSNSPVCANGTLNLFANTITGATYNWTGPNTYSVTGQNPSITGIQTTGAGIYSVTATVAGCTSLPGTTTVAVGTIPVAPAGITGPSVICGGTTNTYTAAAVSNATSYVWTVPAGWSNTAVLNSLSSTANNTSGTITVTANNACGTSPLTSLAVTVTTPLTPSVTISALPGTTFCAGVPVTFTPAPVNGGSTPTYQWLKNGTAVATGSTYTSSTLANNDQVSVIMTTSLPCYTVLTATSAPLTLTVNTIPAAPGAITGSTSVCNATQQQYSIVAVPNATFYTWTLPSGWSGSNTGPSILATTGPLGGVVTVTANNQCGPTAASSTAAITVTSIPAQPGTITGSTTPCAGTVQVYSVGTVSGATSYVWSLPATWTGSSSTASISATPGPGTGTPVTISVSAANVCGPSSPATLAVSPVNTPAQPGAITGSATPCSATQQVYSIAAVPGATSYTWAAPAGWTGASSSTTTSVTLTTTTGGGLVQVTATGVCGTSAPRTLSVTPILSVTPSVTISTPLPAICQNAGATFTAIAVSGGSAPQFQWKKNGVGVGTNAATYTDPYILNGDVITVVMTSNAVCATTTLATSNAITMAVTPTVVPGININTTPPTILCAGTALTFTSNSAGGGPNPAWQWYLNGIAIPGANAPNYTSSSLANNDTLTVLLTSSANCVSAPTVLSNKVGLVVSPVVTPTVVITANPGVNVSAGTSVTFTATATNTGATPTWQWLKNGQVIGIGGTGSTYTTSTLHDGDLISVRLTSYAVCASPNIVTSAALRMTIPTGIATLGAGLWTGSVSLYPNPSTGHFTVAADWGTGHNGERVRLELVNALGQRVYSSEVVPNTAKWSVDVWLPESVANGMYQMRIRGNDAGVVLPVVINR